LRDAAWIAVIVLDDEVVDKLHSPRMSAARIRFASRLLFPE
jgi:hypothetical protein